MNIFHRVSCFRLGSNPRPRVRIWSLCPKSRTTPMTGAGRGRGRAQPPRDGEEHRVQQETHTGQTGYQDQRSLSLHQPAVLSYKYNNASQIINRNIWSIEFCHLVIKSCDLLLAYIELLLLLLLFWMMYKLLYFIVKR